MLKICLLKSSDLIRVELIIEIMNYVPDLSSVPDLVLYEILSLFNLEEKLKLKSVCRRWLMIIENQPIKSLFLHELEISLKENWDFNNRKIKANELMEFELFLKCLDEKYLNFNNLKDLYIYKLSLSKMTQPISKLLSLTSQLEKFFITGCSMETTFLNIFQNLEFEKLKVFGIKEFRKDLKINAPKLERFICWNVEKERQMPFLRKHIVIISVSNPEKIKFIECESFNDSFQLNEFINLEHLVCQNVNSNFNLKNYSKLNQLELCPNKNTDVQNELNIIRNINDQKRYLKRNDLKIFASGFEFNCDCACVCLRKCEHQLFANYLFLYFKDIEVLENNFSKFNRTLPWYTEIMERDSNTNLIDLSNYRFFFSKMNIKKIRIKDDKNFKNLIKFINGINGLDDLSIGMCSNQEFLDELKSIYCIHRLEISNKSINLNFNFLSKIKFLRSFSVGGCSFPLEPIINEFKKSKIKAIQLSSGQQSGYLFILTIHPSRIKLLFIDSKKKNE